MNNNSSLLFSLKKYLTSEGFKRYFANTGWMVIDKFGTLGLSLIVGIFVARYLGPGNFGLLGYAYSISVFFTILSGLGLESILKRDLVNHNDQHQLILGTAFVTRLGGALLSMLLFGLFALVFPEEKEALLLTLIILFGTFFQSFGVIDIYFQSRVRTRPPMMVQLTQFVITNAVRVYLLFIKADLVWFACVLLLAEVLNGLGQVVIYQYHFKDIFKWQYDFTYAKRVLRDCWPLLFSGFVIVIYTNTDQIMIKQMLGNEAAGVYAVANRFSGVWGMLPGILASALFPAILNAKKNSPKLYAERVQKFFDLMVWLSLGVIIPITLTIGRWIIVKWYGQEYAAAGDVLIIHIFSSVFVFLGVGLSYWLISENLQKHSLYRTLIGAVVNIILNFFLIPAMGINGAAVATLFSQAFASYISMGFSKKTRPGFIMQTKALFFLSAFRAAAKHFRRFKAQYAKANY